MDSPDAYLVVVHTGGEPLTYFHDNRREAISLATQASFSPTVRAIEIWHGDMPLDIRWRRELPEEEYEP